jgi:hypothetical protein
MRVVLLLLLMHLVCMVASGLLLGLLLQLQPVLLLHLHGLLGRHKAWEGGPAAAAAAASAGASCNPHQLLLLLLVLWCERPCGVLQGPWWRLKPTSSCVQVAVAKHSRAAGAVGATGGAKWCRGCLWVALVAVLLLLLLGWRPA